MHGIPFVTVPLGNSQTGTGVRTSTPEILDIKTKVFDLLGMGGEGVVESILELLESNKITSLDLRDLPSIKGERGKNLEALLKHAECPLLELDLSGSNVPFPVLEGVKNNSRLITLNLARADFPMDPTLKLALMIEGASSLKHLDLSKVPIGASHSFPRFCEALGKNQMLVSLELTGSRLILDKLPQLAEALSVGKLQYLGMNAGFSWNGEFASNFIERLAGNQSLTYIALRGLKEPGDDFDRKILAMLQKNGTLTVLEPYNTPGERKRGGSSRTFDICTKLEKNHFDKRVQHGGSDQLAILPMPPFVEWLHQVGVDELHDFLHTRQISRLLLKGAYVKESAAEALAKLLAHPRCNVKEIDLSDATFETMGQLFQSMPSNKSLRHLCLDRLRIKKNNKLFHLQSSHFAALGAFLKQTSTLHTLKLCDQKMLGDDRGGAVEPLMVALKQNVRLKHLDMSSSSLKPRHLRSIASALQGHGLEELILTDNPDLNSAGELTWFLKGLVENRSLRRLDLPVEVSKNDGVVNCLHNMRKKLQVCYLSPFSDQKPPQWESKPYAIWKRLDARQRRHAEKLKEDSLRVQWLMMALKEIPADIPQDVRIEIAKQLIRINASEPLPA